MLRGFWNYFFSDKKNAKHPDAQLQIQFAQTIAQNSCPFCLDSDFVSEPAFACSKCRAYQHVSCFVENKNKCAACKAEHPIKAKEISRSIEVSSQGDPRFVKLRNDFDQAVPVTSPRAEFLRLTQITQKRDALCDEEAKRLTDARWQEHLPRVLEELWRLYEPYRHASQKDLALAVKEHPFSWVIFHLHKTPRNRYKSKKDTQKAFSKILERARNKCRPWLW